MSEPSFGLERSPAAHATDPEEAARADWYSLLARLFRAPPDAGLLSRLAGAEAPGASALQDAWSALVNACGSTDAARVKQEYDDAFLGVGKAEVLLYGSYYLAGFLNERPLSDLRHDLAGLGLQRRGDVGETEDHIAALCEVMACLIVSDEPSQFGLDVQRRFFARWLASWYPALCDAIDRSEATVFYKHAGRVLREFLDVERQAFDFVD